MVGQVLHHPQFAFLLGQALHHAAYRMAQRLDFAAAADFRNDRDLAGAQAIGGRGDLAQRPGVIGRHQPADGGEDQRQSGAPDEDVAAHLDGGRVGQVDLLAGHHRPAEAAVIAVAAAAGEAGEVEALVRPLLHRPEVVPLVGQRRQVEALADHVLRAKQHAAVTGQYEELHLVALLLRQHQRAPHLVGPGPGQVRGEHTDDLAARGAHRKGDVDELHRFAGWVGQQLGEQHRFVDVADEASLDAFAEHRALGDVGAFQHAAGGGQDVALGVHVAGPGDALEL